MVTKDLYGRFLCPDADEARLTRTGKWVTAVFLVIAATLAILLRNTDLIKLLDRKFDLLIQMAPAFFLGIHWARLRAGPVFTGMIAGAAVALLLGYCPRIADWLDPDVQGGKPYGLPPGLYGLAITRQIAPGGARCRPGCMAELPLTILDEPQLDTPASCFLFPDGWTAETSRRAWPICSPGMVP